MSAESPSADWLIVMRSGKERQPYLLDNWIRRNGGASKISARQYTGRVFPRSLAITVTKTDQDHFHTVDLIPALLCAGAATVSARR